MLGQEQQFTLILQTLQQLRDVYGDSVDKIVQGNTSNIIFLKSTDDSMLDTLQKMSGTTHRAYKDSKTVTKDMEKIMLQNEGKVSYTMSVKEVPVISYNDMAFIPERNSIVFRAGDSPMWNRNETIFPMSWKLFSDTIVQPGKDYTLQTIPTLSSAMDFDVRLNQPDFYKMVEKRKLQARYAQQAMDAYKQAYGYTDYQISQLDQDVYSDEVMEIINQIILEAEAEKMGVVEEDLPDDFDPMNDFNADMSMYQDNLEQLIATQDAESTYGAMREKKFAGGNIAPSDLVDEGGNVSHNLDRLILAAAKECRAFLLRDTAHFSDRSDGNLWSADGVLYIRKQSESESLRDINKAAKDKDSSVYAEGNVSEKDIEAIGAFVVEDAFIRFLAKCDKWDFAGGRFETIMTDLYERA